MPHTSQTRKLISNRTRTALIFLCTLFLNLGVSWLLPLTNSSLAVLAQAPASKDRKAVADQLSQQGMRQSQQSDYQNALMSFRQALVIYQAIGDRFSTGLILNNIGLIYDSLGQYHKAWEFYQQALAVYTEKGLREAFPQASRFGEGISLNNIGLFYDRQGQYLKAIEFYEQALAICEEDSVRKAFPQESYFGKGYILNNMGDIYRSLGQYTKALNYYQQSLVIIKKSGERAKEGALLNNIGLIYSSQGQNSNALEFYKQALVILKEMSDRFGQGSTLNNIGSIYLELGQYHTALEYLQQALVIRKEISDRSGQGITLSNLGGVYSSQGQYPKALEFYEQSLVISKEIGNHFGQGATLNNIGGIYKRLGQYPKALEYFQQALVIHKEIGAPSSQATTLNNIGLIYENQGEYAKALEFLEQSLRILREIGDRPVEGTTLSNIGLIYENQGEYAKALEFLEQSLVILREIGDLAGQGTTLNNLGVVYASLGQYSKALDYYEQSLVIRKKIGDLAGQGASLNNIGTAYNELGQHPSALEAHQESLAIYKKIDSRSDQGRILGNIGSFYIHQRNYSKALEYYQQALAVIQEMNDRSGESYVLNNIGFIYSRVGQCTKALKLFQQALTICQEIGDRFGQGQSLNNVGACLLQFGDLSKAEAILFESMEMWESLRPGLTDENKVALSDTQVSPYRWQQEALIAQNKVETALEVAERARARAFVELLATRINGTEKSLPQLTETLRPTITQIRQIAKERNSTLIQYSIVDDKTLYVWVVQPQGKVTHRKVDLPQKLSLSELVDASRTDLGVRGRGNFRIEMTNTNPSDRLKQLHQLLIEPIADLLPTDPNAPVIFVPHGELFLVPFPALQDATGKYLIEKHTILTAPAIQVLDLTRQKRQQVKQAGLRDVLIVGNPTMPKVEKPGEVPEQLKALDGAEREANTISALFKTKALTGQQASKAAIMPKLSQARIIHLATHGLLEDLKGLGTPGAIALAPSGTGEPNDGLLTANEILDLKLNAELVVLSACDTGRGKITSDSVIGLSRSLIIAGTPSVIVSLWSVPDAPTAELMTKFYRNWQEKKLDKAQALRQAMLTIMKRPNAKPRDWAAFTLIGEAE